MRLPDWPERLNNYITQQQSKRFRLGVFDCCKFTLGAVEVMTGEDHLPEYQGARAAVDLLNEKALLDRLAEVFEPVPVAFAKKGDIGYYEGACGVVLGRQTIFVGDPWIMVATVKLEAAFSV